MNKISFDQLHSLWIGVWNVLRDAHSKLDGGKIQSAVLSTGHPFWAKLAEALGELRQSLNFAVLPVFFTITVNDDRGMDAIVQCLTPDWKKAVCGEDVAMGVIRSSCKSCEEPEKVKIVFLAANMSVSAATVVAEMERMGFEPALPNDAIRVIEAEPRAPWMTNNGGGNYEMLFLNQHDLSKSILLKYDTMGSETLSMVNVAAESEPIGYACFAARARALA